jgi:uncharacterized protein
MTQVTQMKRAGGAEAEESNSDVVRKGYAAFNAADMATLSVLIPDDASWHTPGRGSIGGLRKGRDAVFGQFGRYGGETAGTFHAEVLQVCEGADGSVVGIHRNTGMRNGKKLDVMCCILFEVRNGQLVSGKEHFFDLYAWEEFWA